MVDAEKVLSGGFWVWLKEW